MSDDENLPAIAKPIEVRGITKADFQSWKHHPVSKWFMEFLEDFRGDLLVSAQHTWLTGQGFDLASAEEYKGWINCLENTVTIDFEHVAEFYDHIDALERGEFEDAE